MNTEAILELLHRAEAGFLGTVGDDGWPYVVPVNFVLLDEVIYFHSASEGHKISNLTRHRQKVCFTVVGAHRVVPSPTERSCPSTTYYESVVAFGRARVVDEPAETQSALESLVAKLVPERAYAPLTPADLQSVTVVAIEVEWMTGKLHDETQ